MDATNPLNLTDAELEAREISEDRFLALLQALEREAGDETMRRFVGELFQCVEVKVKG